MKSTKPRTVIGVKHESIGELPLYIGVGHRHLEKARPPLSSKGSYVVPTDLMRMILPNEYVDKIESLTLTYVTQPSIKSTAMTRVM